MKLLLTGFAPFGGETLNPSLEVARALAAAPPDRVEAVFVELPIDARAAFDVLRPAWRAGGFDTWVGLGQGGGRAHVCVERVAVNLFHARDAAPAGKPERTVIEDGPDAYLSRLPAAELAAAIERAGAPASVSYSAGTFLCNQALYVMEHELRRRAPGERAVFLHLPYLPEQLAGKPAHTPHVALAVQVSGVRAALAWLRDQVLETASG